MMEDLHTWEYFFFLQETGFDISCKLHPHEGMKCQIIFSGKNKKKTSSVLSSTELAQRMVMLK